MKHLLIIIGFTLGLLPFNSLASEESGDFKGKVFDAQTKEPLSFVFVHLEEINRSATADSDGKFRLRNIPPGTYTLFMHRLGYQTGRFLIAIHDGEQLEQSFELVPTGIRSEEVVVRDEKVLTGGNLEHASVRILGEDLRRETGLTLSQTLLNMPGFSERSLGPAPGRPVIRGLSGERVMILEDGFGTGDVSTTAADHSVSIEPLSAQEIEIARGPASLIFTGNAVGGVVNVVNNNIPTSIPSRSGGSATFHGQTVNSQGSASLNYKIPYSNSVFQLALNGRYGLNFNTPNGEILNTYVQTTSNSIAYSWMQPWGYVGTSINLYGSIYGIPPDPQGGHPNGVDIEMIKVQNNSRLEYLIPDSFFKLLEAELSLSAYYHRELESNGAIGTEFAQNMATASFRGRHSNVGIIHNGILGVTTQFIDYQVEGSRTPNSRQIGAAAYYVTESDFGPFHIETGNRIEFTHAFPEEERVSPLIGLIESRTNLGLSSSASLIYNAFGNFYIGATGLLSYRPPSLEELYSEGPHLAAYTYEIGNPQLNPERGLAKELFIRNRHRNFDFELTGFRNYFWNYIYPRDTGRVNIRFPDLNDFQFTETEALFYGIEASTDIRLSRTLSIGGNAALTIANRKVLEEESLLSGTISLPLIPPFSGLVYSSVNIGRFTGRVQMRFADRQTRTGEFESETDGYTVFDANISYNFSAGSLFHTFNFCVQNILDDSYKNHLSLLKDIFPEPGRNVSFMYRVYF